MGIVARGNPSWSRLSIRALIGSAFLLAVAGCTGKGGRIGYRDGRLPSQQADVRTDELVLENRPFDPEKVATDPATGFQMVSDEILVTFKPGTTAQDAEAAVQSIGGKLVGFNSTLDLYEVELPAALTPGEAREKLKANPAVDQAFPNGIAKGDQTDSQSTCGWPDGFPNDPVFKDCDAKNDWGYAKISAGPAWQTTATLTEVVIAILDTGVDSSHPEFADRMLPGRDFVYGGTDTTDRHGHGTHVAGIAAARGNNEKGMAGGCWECKILPVKVLSDGGWGTWMGVLNGIAWAAQQGADVLNMSLGGGRSEDLYKMMEDAIASARKSGALSVVAAGNSNTDASFMLPAAAPSAVTVAATSSTDQRATFSNFGSIVDVSAPGVDIWSTYPNNGYKYMSGTSMAAPMVTGAVGCIFSRGAASSPDEAESLLKAVADSIQTDKPLGAGRLNLGKACTSNGNKPPMVALQADPSSLKPLGVSTITAKASDSDGDPLSYAWTSTGGTLTGTGTTVTWNAPDKVGAYSITVKVSDTHYMVPASLTISVKTGEVYSLVIMPGIVPDMIKGQTQQMKWRIEDEVGQVLNESPAWNVAQGVGSITAGGLFTAENPGEGQIVAEFKGAVTNAKVKVVNRLPTCYASALPLKGHIPFEVEFAGSAVDPDGSIPTGSWSFGDGGTATGMAAKHTYISPGHPDATFTATDAHGGSCTTIIPIQAEPPNKAPTCKASAGPATGKAPLHVQFSSGAQDVDGTVASTLWTFHNGSTQTQSQASFLYTTAGTYSVSLAVKDDDGATCVDQTSVMVLPPNTPPTVIANANPSFGDEPLPIVLSATAWDSDGKISSYAWTTGDGGTSSQASFAHTYKQDGAYTATVTVTDDDGARATAKASVQVKQVIHPPTCTIEAIPTQGKAPLSVSFSGSAADADGSITGTLWSFGDGTSSNSAATSHVYSRAGTFSADFKATDNDDATCHGSVQLNVRPPNQPPTLALQATPPIGNEPLTVQFTSNAGDADGTIVAYQWNFGDGQSSSEANPSHVYVNDGKYTTAVTVTDDDGATATASTVIRVDKVFLPVSCTASAVPEWGSAPLPVQFTGTVSDPGGDVVSSTWDFGDGAFSTQLSPTHTYGIEGAPTATLRVKSACAAKQIVSGDRHTCALLADGTVACWGSNRSGELGDGSTVDRDVPVAVSSLNGVTELRAGRDRTCAVLQDETVQCWGNLSGLAGGDGTSSLVPVAVADSSGVGDPSPAYSHSCSIPSNGTVACWGSNASGQLGDGTTVDRPDPVAVIDLQDAKAVAVGEEHSCALLAGGSIKCWGSDHEGQLGDGASDPTVIRAVPEPIASSLCSACTKTLHISVNPSQPPVCSVSATPVVGPVPLTVSFSAQGSDPEGQPVSFAWTFGDGNPGTGSNPSHSYVSRGIFTTRLTAQDPQGAQCIKEIQIQANPNMPPTCSAAVSPTRGPAPLQTTFTGNAADSDGSIVGSSWNLGNGSTLTTTSGSYSYAQAGTYYPVFTAKDSSGATCSKNSSVKVDAKPVCAISATPTQGRVPLTVSFGGAATDSDGFVMATTWNYGDGSSPGGGFSTHTFQSEGQYTATFTAADNDGYTCTPSLSIKVLPPNKPPTCAASASPAKAHVPGNIPFYGTASDSDGSVAQLFWAFGDGSTSSSQNPSHLYTTPGSFEAKLTVTDNEGATCASTQSIVIEPPNKPPTVSMAATPPKGPEPLNVGFTATTSDPDGQVVTYAWNFGDGTSSAAASPQHLYSQDGTYTATLVVTDDDGATASASAVVVAEKVLIAPNCSASATPIKGHQPLQVTFSGTATDADGSIQSTTWKFGDGSQTAGAGATHTYTTQGSYTAVFSAGDNDGVSCSAQVGIVVEPPNKPPVAVLSADPRAGFVPLAVSLNGAASWDSDGSVVTFEWDFGDGTQGIGSTPAHMFKVWGDFEVKLTVTDDDGARGTATVWIEVWEGDTGSADAWPMFGANAAHHNFSPARLPSTLDILPSIWPSGSGGIGGQELNIPVLSPAISDGLLYTTTSDRLHTFDALTGKALWSLPVPYASDDPTPAIGEGVIVFTTGNELYAYEVATGRLLWGPKSLDLCSDSTSPAIADGLVAAIDCQSNLRVFSLHTGAAVLNALVHGGQVTTPSGSPTLYNGKIWTATPMPSIGKTYLDRWNASPTGFETTTVVDGLVQSAPAAKYNTLFVGDLSGRLSAYDVGTAVRRWTFLAGHSVSTTPAVVRGKVIFGSWDHKVYALDAFTGKLLWSALTDGEIRSNVAVTPDYAIAVSRPGTVYRFKLTDGSLVDSTALGVETWASPALAHGMIYVGSSDGKIHVLGDSSKLQSLTRTWTSLGADAGHTGSAPTLGPTSGSEQFVFTAGGGVNGSAVLNDQGELHFGTASGTFYALQRDATVKWSYPTGLLRGSAAMDGWGNVIAASQGGVVHKISPTGVLLWTYWVANTIQATPCVGPDGSVYVGDTSGKFFGISADGALKFKTSLGDAMRNACATDAAGNIYVGGGDNRLRKFSASGALLFERGFTGPVLTTPTVSENGTVFVSTQNGYFFALTSGGGLLWYASGGGTASVDSNNVYVQSAGGLDVYTRSGSPVWSFRPGGGCSNPVTESPIVDVEGNVFFKHRGGGCTGGAVIHALDPTGQLLWSTPVAAGSDSSPSLGRGRALYLGSGQGLHIFGQN